jgi:RNA polymerase sigma-70 factor (ECF subfamily)
LKSTLDAAYRRAVATWVLTLARRRALNAGERAKEIPNGLVPTIEGRQGKALLSRFSKRLSAEHREVIDLVYYHKRSIGEVGKIFGLSEGLVKSRMLDARRQWRGLLTI